MSAQQFLVPGNHATVRGLAEPGATASLYTTGTLTPQNFYSNSGLSVSLGSTITADGIGVFPIAYQNNATPFRLILKDRHGATLDSGDIDPYFFGLTVGVDGTPATVSVGTTTTGAAGVSAAVTNSGTAENAILNFTLPTGATGPAGDVAKVADRTAMAAIIGQTAGASRFLVEAGREGIFVWSTANLSTNVTADTRQGIYVAPASAPTGASGAWVRKYVGGKDPRWFGAKADGGATDSHTTLQAWLDSGGRRLLPWLGKDEEFYSSATLILRTGGTIEGAGYVFDAINGDVQGILGARIRFGTGARGFDIQPQTALTDVATVLADTAAAFTQEGAMHSSYSNFALIGGGGTTANGWHQRTVVCADNIYVTNFSGKGFHLTSTADTPNADDEYGSTSGSCLANCQAVDNGGDGIKVQGRDAGSSSFLNFTARQNGGWGINSEEEFGGKWEKPTISTNTGGAIRCIGNKATFDTPYIEGGTGSGCVISSGAIVLGYDISAVNTPPDAKPSQITESNSILHSLGINWNYWAGGALPTSHYGLLSGHAAYGLVIQGRGTTFVDETGAIISYISGLNFTSNGNITAVGSVIGAGLKTTNGFVLGPLGNAIIYSLDAPGESTNICSPRNGNFNFQNSSNAAQVTLDCNNQIYNFPGSFRIGGTPVFSSGAVLLAAAFPALTGDVTTSAGSLTTTIPAGTVTLAKMANMATSSLIYRKTAGSGAPEVNTLATLKTDLGLTGTNSGDQTITLTGNVTGSGTGSFATTVASVPAAAMPALTGDITTSAGAVATTLATNIVTYAKFQQVAASSLVGNATGSLANATGITLGSTLAFSGSALQTAAITGDVTASANSFATTLATNIVTYAKFQQVAASSLVGNATGSLANATGITLAGGLAFSGSTLTAAGALTPTSVVSSGGVSGTTISGSTSVLSTGTGGVGYAAGAGGTAAQSTSKATTVSGTNKMCVDITLNAAALAASTTVSFTFTNTVIAATDNLIINHISVGTFGSYTFNGRCAAGSATIDVRNVSLGSLSEAIVIRVTVLKGANT